MLKQQLTIEIRNINMGPVKDGENDGLFMQTQTRGTWAKGIGDGLFIKPQQHGIGEDQLGYEGLIRPAITILYKDGSAGIEEPNFFNNEDAIALPEPGKEAIWTINLSENKTFNDIKQLVLSFVGARYGSSRNGGNGMSYTRTCDLGQALLRGDKITRDGKITAKVSLSDRWNLQLHPDEYQASEDELLKIEFLTQPQDVQDNAWRNVMIVDEWRSTLEPKWQKNPGFKSDYNLHNPSLWTMPIALFKPQSRGWVIGINEGYRFTKEMRDHVRLFSDYAKKPEYIAEKEAAEAWLSDRYGKSSATVDPKQPAADETPAAAQASVAPAP